MGAFYGQGQICGMMPAQKGALGDAFPLCFDPLAASLMYRCRFAFIQLPLRFYPVATSLLPIHRFALEHRRNGIYQL